jgi:hypothetical protein
MRGTQNGKKIWKYADFNEVLSQWLLMQSPSDWQNRLKRPLLGDRRNTNVSTFTLAESGLPWDHIKSTHTRIHRWRRDKTTKPLWEIRTPQSGQRPRPLTKSNRTPARWATVPQLEQQTSWRISPKLKFAQTCSGIPTNTTRKVTAPSNTLSTY